MTTATITEQQYVRPGTRPGGRRSMLTPHTARAIVKVLGRGGSLTAAAAAAHVSSRTLQRWRARGRDADTGLYRELFLACQGAEFEHDLSSLGSIVDVNELLGVVAADSAKEEA
jgi:hypothetical protein